MSEKIIKITEAKVGDLITVSRYDERLEVLKTLKGYVTKIGPFRVVPDMTKFFLGKFGEILSDDTDVILHDHNESEA